jgi:hypothetical protein
MTHLHLRPTTGAGAILIVLSTTILASGCKPSKPADPMAAVGGTVTYRGSPLADGLITFATPTRGVFEAIPIKEGRFTGRARLGERRVEIAAFREGKPLPPGSPGAGVPYKEQYLPEKYSSESTLTADVKADQPNAFSFDLTDDGR